MTPLPIYHPTGSTFFKSPLNQNRVPSSPYLIGSENLPILPPPIVPSLKNPKSPDIIASTPSPSILADFHSYPTFRSTGSLHQGPQTAVTIATPVPKSILEPATPPLWHRARRVLGYLAHAGHMPTKRHLVYQSGYTDTVKFNMPSGRKHRLHGFKANSWNISYQSDLCFLIMLVSSKSYNSPIPCCPRQTSPFISQAVISLFGKDSPYRKQAVRLPCPIVCTRAKYNLNLNFHTSSLAMAGP